MMARRDYRNMQGKKLPGVTNILEVLNKPALVFWGYRQGKWNFDEVTERIMGCLSTPTWQEYPDFALEQIKKIISDFPVRPLYEQRDQAATAGTLAHSLVEAYLKHEPIPPIPRDPIGQKADACFEAFLEWAKNHQFKMVASEKQMVSARGFGGTIDIGAVVSDLNIVDIKTSNDVYLTMKIQVAAYGDLWDENSEDKIKGYRILRLGTEGDFSEHYWSNLDAEKEIFDHALKIYQLLKATDQRL